MHFSLSVRITDSKDEVMDTCTNRDAPMPMPNGIALRSALPQAAQAFSRSILLGVGFVISPEA
jgi:hypothetical protein